MFKTLKIILPLFFTIWATFSHAVTFLRDPDIEHGLQELARPILVAAGLSPSTIRIIIVDDPKFNAFVINSSAIYLNKGLILKVNSAAQLQSVIAHEAAHIVNNHFSRRMAQIDTAKRISILGLGAAAAIALSGQGEAAFGIALGAQGTALRNLLPHTRAEENAADQSGVRYMLGAKIPTRAALEVIDIFRGQEALNIQNRDPYAVSHPLSEDRYRTLQAYVQANPGPAENLPKYDQIFSRLQAKLSAFSRAPSWTLRRITGTSFTDRMQRAIAYHRIPDTQNAIKEITSLAAQYPQDPYLRELEGQILLESLKTDAALKAYASAVDIAPDNSLILSGYGRALLIKNTDTSNRKALDILLKARSKDLYSAALLRDLGLAYARTGQPAMASLSVAERLALSGRLKDAAVHAQRAQKALPVGSSGWQRAQDILRALQR